MPSIKVTNDTLDKILALQIAVAWAGEGIKYDQSGKHLKAIDKGQVPTRGSVGLVPSQEEGYDFKSKVLGKGGDRRFFHAKFIDGVLHFPGLVTEH